MMYLKKSFLGAVVAVCGFAGSISSVRADDQGTVVGKLDGQILATGDGKVIRFDSTGKELWRFGGSNCHDVWMLDNGNVLVADGSVREIDPKANKVVFEYKPKETGGGGAFSCQRLKNGNTLVGENSTGRVLEVDKNGKIVFELAVKPYTPHNHGNLRMVRKLDNGNYLVCHAYARFVREYTPDGKIVFEVKPNNMSFSAVRLKNGNTVVGELSRVVEYDKDGKEVWSLNTSDLKGLKLGKITGVNVLPNGNMVLGIYSADNSKDGAAILEVSRDKKVVWRYFKLKNGDRAMMSAQKLDESGKPISSLR